MTTCVRRDPPALFAAFARGQIAGNSAAGQQAHAHGTPTRRRRGRVAECMKYIFVFRYFSYVRPGTHVCAHVAAVDWVRYRIPPMGGRSAAFMCVCALVCGKAAATAAAAHTKERRESENETKTVKYTCTRTTRVFRQIWLSDKRPSSCSHRFVVFHSTTNGFFKRFRMRRFLKFFFFFWLRVRYKIDWFTTHMRTRTTECFSIKEKHDKTFFLLFPPL